jgi:hypothetical protein
MDEDTLSQVAKLIQFDHLFKSSREDSELKHHHEVAFDLASAYTTLSRSALWSTRHAPDAGPAHLCVASSRLRTTIRCAVSRFRGFRFFML